jgi:hypothetical protein
MVVGAVVVAGVVVGTAAVDGEEVMAAVPGVVVVGEVVWLLLAQLVAAREAIIPNATLARTGPRLPTQHFILP